MCTYSISLINTVTNVSQSHFAFADILGYIMLWCSLLMNNRIECPIPAGTGAEQAVVVSSVLLSNHSFCVVTHMWYNMCCDMLWYCMVWYMDSFTSKVGKFSAPVKILSYAAPKIVGLIGCGFASETSACNQIYHCFLAYW
jgi:hypothetical protein